MSRKRPLTNPLFAMLIAVAILTSGLVAACSGGGNDAATDTQSPTASTAAAPATTALAPTATAPALTAPAPIVNVTAIANLADVVARVMPSVVEIETSGAQSGVGTGIVLDREGHVLTNYHVIEGAAGIVVRLRDGTAGVAEVVGTDPGSDLAIVRASIQPQRLSPATFADSDVVRAGDAVFAIGNPFGQNFSVTSGIVSAIDRVTTSSFTGRPIRGVIQTDASLNPGNSGGPLFDAAGEVIGINTSIENPGGRFSAGVGFATPSNSAQRFIPAMLAGQNVEHPMLGIRGETLDEVNSQNYGLTVSRGVYVVGTERGSAAATAGLRAAATNGVGGDVITAVDGRPVISFDDLALAIDAHQVGETVTMTVSRAGQTMELTATLGAWTSGTSQ